MDRSVEIFKIDIEVGSCDSGWGVAAQTGSCGSGGGVAAEAKVHEAINPEVLARVVEVLMEDLRYSNVTLTRELSSSSIRSKFYLVGALTFFMISSCQFIDLKKECSLICAVPFAPSLF